VSIARQRDASEKRSWRDHPASVVLFAVASKLGAFGRASASTLKFQYVESQAPAHPPRWIRWHDGRRFRATAAGRRRGRGRQPGFVTSIELASGVGLLLILAVATGSFLGASAVYVKYASQLPDARSIVLNTLPEDSILYDSTGQTVLMDVHQKGYRHYEQRLKDMGPLAPKATVAIEDAKFYTEGGIDLPSIVRAAWVDYHEHKAVQGASTITQQLVKLRLIGNQPTIDRKVKEAVLAIQVEQDFSKDQVLEMYLNTAFFGNNAYGIEAAAQSYYHTDTAKLSLGQAAMLAGIPQNPTWNNPLVNWPGAKARQHDVLAAMVRNRMITPEQSDKAYAEDLSAPSHMFQDSNVIAAPAFSQFVVDELKARFGPEAPYRNGYRVTTTLNWDMEQKAQQLITAQVRRYESGGSNVHDGAMVGIDPKTGEIMSMIGSADLNARGGQYNMAVWPPRNPGSSMKMYTYTAAIASGLDTMVTPIQDSTVTYHSTGSTFTPKNYDGGLHGTCQLQACFLNSLNIPATKVEMGIGIPAVAQMARTMGAPPWTCHLDAAGNCKYTADDPLDSYGPSLTLGGYNETPLQMATGASVLAAQGILRPAHSVRQVLNASGGLVYKSNPDESAKQVIDPKVAFIMEQIMSDDSNRAMIFGRGSNLTLPNRTVASKTGTTDDYKDGWTVGFTPALATAFWFGNTDWTPMPIGAEASQVAAPVWHDFMQYTLDNILRRPNEWFNEPAGLGHANVNGKLQWFMPGTSPSTQAPRLPTSANPSNGWWATQPAPPPAPAPAPPAPPSDRGGGGGRGGGSG